MNFDGWQRKVLIIFAGIFVGVCIGVTVRSFTDSLKSDEPGADDLLVVDSALEDRDAGFRLIKDDLPKTLGTLYFEDGKFHFNGDADASAVAFLETLNGELKKQVDKFYGTSNELIGKIKYTRGGWLVRIIHVDRDGDVWAVHEPGTDRETYPKRHNPDGTRGDNWFSLDPNPRGIKNPADIMLGIAPASEYVGWRRSPTRDHREWRSKTNE